MGFGGPAVVATAIVDDLDLGLRGKVLLHELVPVSVTFRDDEEEGGGHSVSPYRGCGVTPGVHGLGITNWDYEAGDQVTRPSWSKIIVWLTGSVIVSTCRAQVLPNSPHQPDHQLARTAPTLTLYLLQLSQGFLGSDSLAFVALPGLVTNIVA